MENTNNIIVTCQICKKESNGFDMWSSPENIWDAICEACTEEAERKGIDCSKRILSAMLVNHRIKNLSIAGVFEENITEWILDYKNGISSKEDILNVTEQVAKYRNTPELLEEINQRLN
jgi:Na+-transporting NADH:ubiquinone oxidoreductase subunit NqrC